MHTKFIIRITDKKFLRINIHVQNILSQFCKRFFGRFVFFFVQMKNDGIIQFHDEFIWKQLPIFT